MLIINLHGPKMFIKPLLIGSFTALFTINSAHANDWEPVSPEQGGPRNWEVSSDTSLYQSQDTDSSKAAALSKGQILDNLGCEQVDEITWCYSQPFGGGPVGFVQAQYLTPARSADGTIGYGPDDSAFRAGQSDFDATGKIPCSEYAGQPMGQCEFGVSRSGSGYATVVVYRIGNSDRIIFFRLGKATGISFSEADKTGLFSTEYEDDLHHIKVGDERYEIPDAVIYGG